MKKLLLLDADVVLDLHTFDLFDKVCNAYDLYLTKTVRDETRYYKKNGERFGIKLSDKVKIIEDIEIESLAFVTKNAKDAVLEINPGEATSIAYIIKTDEDIKLCTCDKAAITLVSFMNLEKKCISLENALKKIGIKKDLYPRHWNANFEECIKRGKELRIYNLDLT